MERIIAVERIGMHPDLFYRSEIHNRDGLRESMAGPNGQLQAIIVDEQLRLVFGLRRLHFAKELGWETIRARVIDLDDPLKAIEDENACRAAFTLTEKTKLYRMIEAREKEKARDRQAATQAKPGQGKVGGSGAENVSAPEKHEKNGKAADKAAKAAGITKPTVEKVEEVQQAAAEHPELEPILEEMEETGNVSKAHKKVREAAKATPAPAVDDWGIPITKEAAAAFADRAKFDELLKVLRQAKRLYGELADLPGGKLLTFPGISMNAKDAWRHAGIETAIRNIEDCRPKYTVCPYTTKMPKGYKHGADCTLCRGLGWVGTIPKERCLDDLIAATKKAHGVS